METVYDKIELTFDDVREMDFYPCKYYHYHDNKCTNEDSLAYNDSCRMLHCQFFCKWYGDKNGEYELNDEH